MQSKSIKSILKVGNIVDVLSSSPEPLSLAALAKSTGLVKSTLHGLVSTLVEIGYVEQVPDNGYYQLGIRLFEIGNSISNKWNEKRIAYPYMQEIVEKTGETVHMAILSDGEVLYIEKLESSRSIQIVTASGVKLPAYCTGLGKALMSNLPTEDIKRICQATGFVQHTENTIMSCEALMAELAVIRDRGYSVDEQEFMIGLRCIAVPIYNHFEKVVAAISIAAPLSRMQGERFELYKELLMSAGQQISARLGYKVSAESR
ncbi:MAG: IclR family transcriptional regulator [Eubacteriaceae bacterium]|nr:IclR family transcriptional regulator [Eubacteriaceae bacterium]